MTDDNTLLPEPELSDDFVHTESPFSLLALGSVMSAAGIWWANPALHARCIGDRPVYFIRYDAPAAIWAPFPQGVDRSLATEMLRLAGRCQIIVEALPKGWGAPIEVIIWRKPRGYE